MDLRGRMVKALHGQKVKLDAVIRGVSGIEHKFDIIVEAWKIKVPIDILPENVALDELKLIQIYTKTA